MARTHPWEVSDALWKRVEPLIPARPPHPKGGRPAADDRQMFAAIIYVLRTGIQWNALPRELVVNDPKCRSYTHLVITAHQHAALKVSIRSPSDFWKCLRSSATFDSPNVWKNDFSPYLPPVVSGRPNRGPRASSQHATAAASRLLTPLIGVLSESVPDTDGYPAQRPHSDHTSPQA